MKQFYVYVTKTVEKRYVVEADNVLEAEHKVEESENTDDDFGFKTTYGEWRIVGSEQVS